jgi:hypothetical protein
VKENSIEEDIKNAEHFIKSIKTDKEYKEDGWHGYYNKEIVELARILQHILSDYKRVLEINEVLLKENEILKEEKEQAWEEWNNLEQGSYEIEQKLKQQIKKSQKENEELKNQEATARKINELLVQRYSNSISFQKVKDKIRHYQELQDNYIKKYDEINEGLQAMINVLQELLEGRK